MTSLIAKKNRYYKYIWEYVRRRDKLRLRYHPLGKRPRYPSKAYLSTVAVYNKKLKHWRLQLKRLDRVRDEIEFLEKTIKDFFGKSIKYTELPDNGMSVPHCIYFKFGIEKGLSGVHLSEHIRFKKVWNASRFRREFTKSFASNHDNKETWTRFKRFYERRIEAESNHFISNKQTA